MRFQMFGLNDGRSFQDMEKAMQEDLKERQEAAKQAKQAFLEGGEYAPYMEAERKAVELEQEIADWQFIMSHSGGLTPDEKIRMKGVLERNVQRNIAYAGKVFEEINRLEREMGETKKEAHRAQRAVEMSMRQAQEFGE